MHESFTGMLLLIAAASAFGELPPPVALQRTDAPITVDGDLSEPAWQHATRYETWYETNPGDNIEPKQKTTGWVTYDSKFLYVAVEAATATNIVRSRASASRTSRWRTRAKSSIAIASITRSSSA